MLLASPAFLITFLLSAINKEKKPKSKDRLDENMDDVMLDDTALNMQALNE